MRNKLDLLSLSHLVEDQRVLNDLLLTKDMSRDGSRIHQCLLLLFGLSDRKINILMLNEIATRRSRNELRTL